jgi:hypothetical protein
VNVVSILFEIEKDKQSWVFSDIKTMIDSLEKRGYNTDFYRDRLNENRFMLNYYSEKPEEQLVDLLKNEPAVKSFFQKLKSVSERVEVSSFEKLF